MFGYTLPETTGPAAPEAYKAPLLNPAAKGPTPTGTPEAAKVYFSPNPDPVTSSDAEPFARAHRRVGILEHFEFALTREQYDRSKPDPEPYLRAVARVGLPAARCLAIEDSERGLRAAKAAGLTCWMVPSPLTRAEPFAGADSILPDLAAVVRKLCPDR